MMHKILFLLCVVIVSGQKFTNKRFTVKKDGEYWYAMEKVGNGRLDWVRNRASSETQGQLVGSIKCSW